jgi:hypothetical protein
VGWSPVGAPFVAAPPVERESFPELYSSPVSGLCIHLMLTWLGQLQTYFERRVQRLSIPLGGRHFSGARYVEISVPSCGRWSCWVACFQGRLRWYFDNRVALRWSRQRCLRLRCVCICRKIENGYCGMSSQEGMYYFQVEEEKRGMLVVVLLEDTWTVM